MEAQASEEKDEAEEAQRTSPPNEGRKTDQRHGWGVVGLSGRGESRRGVRGGRNPSRTRPGAASANGGAIRPVVPAGRPPLRGPSNEGVSLGGGAEAGWNHGRDSSFVPDSPNAGGQGRFVFRVRSDGFSRLWSIGRTHEKRLKASLQANKRHDHASHLHHLSAAFRFARP